MFIDSPSRRESDTGAPIGLFAMVGSESDRVDRPSTGVFVITAGLSQGTPCGVADHARILAEALETEGVRGRTIWGDIAGAGPRALSRWWREVARSVESLEPDALVLHYSVFAFSVRGVPLYVPLLARWLRRTDLPVVLFAHELAVPWQRNEWRGWLWGASQRAVLPFLVAATSAIIVTVDDRATWLRRRPWIPRRPILVAPTFSNLSEQHIVEPRSTRPIRAGVFGYPAEVAPFISRAVAQFRYGEPGAQLWLLGRPGRDTPTGRAWCEAASAAGIADAIHFTGVIAAQELAREIAGCHVLVFDDRGGPSSRKTTLAAALASGRPVVAVDGPNTWPALARARAVELVPRDPVVLGRTLARIAADPLLQEALGIRGRAFYERHQRRGVVARDVADFLRQFIATPDPAGHLPVQARQTIAGSPGQR